MVPSVEKSQGASKTLIFPRRVLVFLKVCWVFEGMIRCGILYMDVKERTI